jgi:hypothetical protein
MSPTLRSLLTIVTVATVACRNLGPGRPSPTGDEYVPGQSYLGRHGNIEYLAGNAPLILSAPHGGTLRPSAIPQRSCGQNSSDLNTQDVARAIRSAYFAQFGKYPHVIINRLHRDRLDANRDSVEATCGNATAGEAWSDFHRFMGVAKARVVADLGRGFYIDLHGHGHAAQRLEIGYLLTGETLDLTDGELDTLSSEIDGSSVRTIARAQGAVPFAALLRGPTSLGTLFANRGFPAVPSAMDPSPRGAEYFRGGYNSQRHGCTDSGLICGVQIEANYNGVRDTPANRQRFAEATVGAVAEFLSRHWGLNLNP